MRKLTGAVCAAAAMAISTGFLLAQDMASPSEAFRIARGGQLYDKWWVVLNGTKPEETHPAYPDDGQYKADATWRCKECHGWDYKGAEGAYSSGKHFTGIVGVAGSAGADPAAIVEILRAEPHGYTADMLPDDAAEDLALFISKGQIDPTTFMSDGMSSGDAAAGQVYYEGVCVGCHGLDGKKVKDMDPLGAIAGNTVETMHKILNGQPGEAMPALRVLDPQISADLTAYAQTLPKE
ncbi:Cytochrome C oxidase, cbb3-type, subunit III [Aliiruegeria lutimaris]|uniref:Cytochrome C oxidase, cbb3-type, subunit III n=2 Tax=Aliiruegeria lutimaris TaxID=571298 RepID=A0A1G9QGN1_9RHOB|nr:Cytochrome C oxidase, cbb3-type, subunit III [Aliiruegeria lutimaris]